MTCARRAQLAEIIPYAALQFGSYAALKSALLQRRADRASSADAHAAAALPQPLSSWDKFCCGLVAGCASKLALHPLDVAKKRMQVAGLARPAAYGASVARGQYAGALHCLVQLARTEGAAGLYKGLAPNLLKAAPASGITFVVYEALVAAMARAGVLC